jgi:hypothetical protein
MTMADAIHIHEDDRGMRNLYPLVTRAEVEADMDECVAAAERNRAPSDPGYTAIHQIEPPSQDYAEFGLTLAKAEEVLAPILPRIRRFYATAGSAIGSAERDPLGVYEEDAWCFGLDASCYIKLDANGPLVGNIWFNLDTEDVDVAHRLRRAIEAINALVSSIIADYFLHFSGSASDHKVLDSYFAALARRS